MANEMANEIEVIDESQPFLTVKISEQHEETPCKHQVINTSHLVIGAFKDKLKNIFATLRSHVETALIALACLAFLIFVIFSIKHENKVILICLLFLIPFLCLFRKSGRLNAAQDGMNNRLLQVTLLRLILVVVVSLNSSTSLKIKLYSSLIMLADPLASGINRFDRMRDFVRLVWQTLVSWNRSRTVCSWKVIALIWVIYYHMKYDSIGAGFTILVKICACVAAGLVTLMISTLQKWVVKFCTSEPVPVREINFFFNSSQLAQFTEIRCCSWLLQRLQEVAFEFSDIVRLQGLGSHAAETTVKMEPSTLANNLSPVQGANQNVPSVNGQNNQAAEVEKSTCSILAAWFCPAAYALTLALILTVLVPSLDDAQNKDLLWLSTAVPSGFFGVILVPVLINIVEFGFDMAMVFKNRGPSLSQICTSLMGSLVLASLVPILTLYYSKRYEFPIKLDLYVSAVAWFNSLLLYYLWEIAQWREVLDASYLLYLIWYSIVWASTLGWPFFVTLFTV